MKTGQCTKEDFKENGTIAGAITLSLISDKSRVYKGAS